MKCNIHTVSCTKVSFVSPTQKKEARNNIVIITKLVTKYDIKYIAQIYIKQ